jgi:hypothetical protein
MVLHGGCRLGPLCRANLILNLQKVSLGVHLPVLPNLQELRVHLGLQLAHVSELGSCDQGRLTLLEVYTGLAEEGEGLRGVILFLLLLFHI